MRQHAISPLRIFDGADCLEKLGRELQRLGASRAVVFCGTTLGQSGSPIDIIKDTLGGNLAGVFKGVKAHSPLPAVVAGADTLRKLDADAVIAVGGGSAIVTARASSILVAEAGEIDNLCTSRDANGQLRSPKLMAPKLPQIVVPTTPTTAMAKAGSAVLDPETSSRRALFDPKTRAGSVFLHPELLGSSPRKLLIDASLNSFCSAAEGLMSRNGDPIADALLMQAIRLIAKHLFEPSDLDQPEPRTDLAYAAIMSGRGTDHTAGGVTTALGHAVAAHCGVEAGVIKMIMLPHAVEFNAEEAQNGLEKLELSLGTHSHDQSLSARVSHTLIQANQRLGLAVRLRDAGISRVAFDDIAEKAMSDWFLRGNPRPISKPQELVSLLEAAW